MAFDYTPKSIADIVYADDATEQLIKDLVSGARPYPYSGRNGILLYGTPGTGKTTLGKLLPAAIENARGGRPGYTVCDEKIQPDNNGVDLFARLKNSIEHVTGDAIYWHVVLDEVDLLTPVVMGSLKSLMDTPTALWVLITNNVNKINLAVKDRCHMIAFNAAPADRWLPFAHRVMTDYGVAPIDDGVLRSVIDTGHGSARFIVDNLCLFANNVRVRRGLPRI